MYFDRPGNPPEPTEGILLKCAVGSEVRLSVFGGLLLVNEPVKMELLYPCVQKDKDLAMFDDSSMDESCVYRTRVQKRKRQPNTTPLPTKHMSRRNCGALNVQVRFKSAHVLTGTFVIVPGVYEIQCLHGIPEYNKVDTGKLKNNILDLFTSLGQCDESTIQTIYHYITYHSKKRPITIGFREIPLIKDGAVGLPDPKFHAAYRHSVLWLTLFTNKEECGDARYRLINHVTTTDTLVNVCYITNYPNPKQLFCSDFPKLWYC